MAKPRETVQLDEYIKAVKAIADAPIPRAAFLSCREILMSKLKDAKTPEDFREAYEFHKALYELAPHEMLGTLGY